MFDWTNSVINFFRLPDFTAINVKTKTRELEVYIRNSKTIESLEDAVNISICLSMYAPDHFGLTVLSEPAIAIKQYEHLTDKLKEYFELKTIQIQERVYI